MIRVLVVDDAISIRQLLASVLAGCGYEVVEADCGQRALSRLAEGLQPHLVICDINMPGISGIEFITSFRKLDGHAQTPVIILSSEISQEVQLNGRRAGANTWVTKPFRPDKLLEVVQKFAPVMA